MPSALRTLLGAIVLCVLVYSCVQNTPRQSADDSAGRPAQPGLIRQANFALTAFMRANLSPAFQCDEKREQSRVLFYCHPYGATEFGGIFVLPLEQKDEKREIFAVNGTAKGYVRDTRWTGGFQLLEWRGEAIDIPATLSWFRAQ